MKKDYRKAVVLSNFLSAAETSFTEATFTWLEEEFCLTNDDYFVLFGGAVVICGLLTAYVFLAVGLNLRF